MAEPDFSHQSRKSGLIIERGVVFVDALSRRSVAKTVMKRRRSLFSRLNNKVRRNLTRRSNCCEGGSADKAMAFHRSSLREKALLKNACRLNPLRTPRNQRLNSLCALVSLWQNYCLLSAICVLKSACPVRCVFYYLTGVSSVKSVADLKKGKLPMSGFQ
jgi:hypothetical protein